MKSDIADIFGGSDDEEPKQPKEKKKKAPATNQHELKAGISARPQKREKKPQKESVGQNSMNVGLEESDGKMIFKKANLINFENLQLSLFYKGGFAREERMNIQDIIDYVYAEGKIYPKAEPLAEEDDEKNIEYKLKLVDHSIERIEHLTTQMKFRLEEGSGEAFYNLGYEDSGNPLGICKEEVVFSLQSLCYMASQQVPTASLHLLKVYEGEKGKTFQLMCKSAEREGVKLEVRVSLLGDFEAGKSSLIGVLSSGVLDDGKGLARLRVLNHKHEVLTGITSSQTISIIGFDANGGVANHIGLNSSWDKVVESSVKIISFRDVGGHQKFSKSLIKNFMANMPDYAILVINPTKKISSTTIEHFRLASALQIPTFIVLTHIDKMNEDSLEDFMIDFRTLKRSLDNHSNLLVVKSLDDVVFFSKNIKEDILPLFQVSCVTGAGLSHLMKFLNVLPVQTQVIGEGDDSTAEFLIQTKFTHDDKIILGGTVTKGKIKKRQIVYIGPDEEGEFRKVEINSIHCHKVAVNSASCGQSCSVSVKFGKLASEWLSKTTIRQGMVLVENRKRAPKAVYEFKAEFMLIGKDVSKTELPPFYEPVITSFTFRQTCVTVGNDPKPINGRKEDEILHCMSMSPERPELPATKNIKSLQSPFNFKKEKPFEGTKPRLLSSNDCFQSCGLFSQENKPNYEKSPPPLMLKKFRSRSKDDVIYEIEVSDQDADAANHKPKRLKYPQECEIDQLLRKKNKPASRTLLTKVSLAPGEKTTLRFRFKYHPVYIQPGYKLLINDDKLKAIGNVTEIFTL